MGRKFSFYGNTTDLARRLLGQRLIHESSEGTVVGKIVETEAYLSDDPACHGYRGETPRTKTLFGPPGRSYVYFIYGMYHCFNIVSAPAGVGEGVLIRAVEPTDGIELMQFRRSRNKLEDLTSGPGKVASAFGITLKHNGFELTTGPLRIEPGSSESRKVVTTTRIGISRGEDLLLRFYLKGNPHVSKF